MFDVISRYWKADKALFISAVLFIAILGLIFISVIFSYNNLRFVQGQVSLINVDAGKHTHLTIKLLNDSNRYYQQYESRFYDAGMNNVHKGDNIKFYTFSGSVRKPSPLLGGKDEAGFNYYPIFYINKNDGLLQLFYFYAYHAFYSIALLFAGVLVLYNGFPIVYNKQLLPKIPIYLLTIFLIWLSY